MSDKQAAFGVFLLGFAVVAGAWGFEIIGRYQPCALCLQQRIPYYVGVPVALLLGLFMGRITHLLGRLGFVFLVVVFAVSLFFAVRHAGVEWGWWLGPSDCGAGDLTKPVAPLGTPEADPDLIPVYCDKAALRILGLSFAGWNAVASLALIALAALGAWRTKSQT